MRREWSRFIFRMWLRGDEKRMCCARQLYHLHEKIIWRNATDHETGLGKTLTIGVVKLVPMSMTLRNNPLLWILKRMIFVINFICQCALFHYAVVCAQTHARALAFDTLIFGIKWNLVNNRITRVWINFASICFGESHHIARKLN